MANIIYFAIYEIKNKKKKKIPGNHFTSREKSISKQNKFSSSVTVWKKPKEIDHLPKEKKNEKNEKKKKGN